MTFPWQRFRPEFRVPKAITDLVSAGILRDGTTRDSTPNFGTQFFDGSELILWVDHPQSDKRFFSESRYSLVLKEPGDPMVTLLDTDDVQEVVNAIRQVFDEKAGPRPLP